MIVAVIAALLILFVIVILLLQFIPGGTSLKGPGYAEGFRAARELAYGAGARSPDRADAFSGKVTSVSGSSVTFTVSGLILDERVDGAGLVRTATVSNDTKIVMMQERSDEEYQTAHTAYLAARDAAEATDPGLGPRPPSRFTEVAISLSDIQEGDSVTVEPVQSSTEGEGSLSKGMAAHVGSKSFPAARIVVSHPEIEPVPKQEPDVASPASADPMPTPRTEEEMEMMEGGE